MVRIFRGAALTFTFTVAKAPVGRVAVMTAVPFFFALIFPLEDTDATDVSLLVYFIAVWVVCFITGYSDIFSPVPRVQLAGERRREPARFLFRVNALIHTLLYTVSEVFPSVEIGVFKSTH